MYNFQKIILILILLTSCGSTEKSIKVNLVKTDFPAYLKYENNKPVSISLPIELQVQNNSSKSKRFGQVLYMGSSLFPGHDLFSIQGESIKKERQLTTDTISIKGNELKQFIIYTHHALDTSYISEFYLEEYKNRMKNSKSDTLNIGSYEKIKEKHPVLINSIRDSDSIILYFGSYKKEELITQRFKLQLE